MKIVSETIIFLMKMFANMAGSVIVATTLTCCAPEKYVTLKVSGDGYTIGSLTASDFVVYPDWSGVKAGGKMINIS